MTIESIFSLMAIVGTLAIVALFVVACFDTVRA